MRIDIVGLELTDMLEPTRARVVHSDTSQKHSGGKELHDDQRADWGCSMTMQLLPKGGELWEGGPTITSDSF